MKSKAAILWDTHTKWSVEEIDLDPPKAGEVLVEPGGVRSLPLRRAPRDRRHGP